MVLAYRTSPQEPVLAFPRHCVHLFNLCPILSPFLCLAPVPFPLSPPPSFAIIHRGDVQHWELLPAQAAMNVRVGSIGGGSLGFPEFPKWLGMYSRENKRRRMLGELSTHLNSAISGGPEVGSSAGLAPLRFGSGWFGASYRSDSHGILRWSMVVPCGTGPASRRLRVIPRAREVHASGNGDSPGWSWLDAGGEAEGSTLRKREGVCRHLTVVALRSRAQAVRLSYLPFLKLSLTRPLRERGVDGAQECADALEEYGLSRDDLFEVRHHEML